MTAQPINPRHIISSIETATSTLAIVDPSALSPDVLAALDAAGAVRLTVPASEGGLVTIADTGDALTLADLEAVAWREINTAHSVNDAMRDAIA
jgi:hypothetical protein